MRQFSSVNEVINLAQKVNKNKKGEDVKTNHNLKARNLWWEFMHHRAAIKEAISIDEVAAMANAFPLRKAGVSPKLYNDALSTIEDKNAEIAKLMGMLTPNQLKKLDEAKKE